MKTVKVPKLRFSEFKKEFELTTLDENTIWKSGGTPKKDNLDYWDGSIPWISASEMRGKYYSRSKYNITKEALGKGSKLAKEGSLLLLVRGSMLFNKIPIGIAKIDLAFNQDVKSIRPKDNLNNEYLFQWFKSHEHRIMNLVVGTGIGAGKLDTNEMKGLVLNLPTLPEQTKIANFLTAVDAKITNLSDEKILLEKYKKGLMQKIFSQELRFKQNDGSDFPEWETKRLGDVALITMGQSPSSSSYNSDGIGKYLIQGNADIKNRKTEPRIWTNEATKECKVGDLILTVRAPVGAVALSGHDACIGRGVCSIRNKANSIQGFIYQFLKFYETKWIRIEQGSTFTAVSGKDIKSLRLNIPHISEQTKIANFLTSIDDKINTATESIENAQKWKKGLLQQLFI